MLRKCLLTVTVMAAVAISGLAQDDAPPLVTFDWYGQGCFMVGVTSGVRILIDPVNIKEYRVPTGLTPDIVTVSHNHRDHNAVETVSGDPVVIWGKTREEIDPEQKFIPVDTTISGVRIYNVVSNHHPPDHSPTLNAIFVYEFDSLRLVHLGDLGTTLSEEQIAQIGTVDVLMIPVGGRYTIAGAMADSVVAQLKPTRAVIPMHFKTKIADFLPYTGKDFVEGKTNVIKLPGNVYADDPTEKATELRYVLFECFD